MKHMLMIASFIVLFGVMTACKSSELHNAFPDHDVASLVVAAESGNTNEIHKLIKSGVSIDTRGKGGITPLMWCLYHLNMVGYKALLNERANPNLQQDDGESVIQWAAKLEDSSYLRLALEHGGNPNLLNIHSAYDRSPLFSAIGPKTKNNVELLINAGANLNLMSPIGTPLMAAASANQYDIAFMLLVAGADYKVKDKSGTTVVWEIEHGNIDKDSEQYKWRDKVIQFLLQHGVTIRSVSGTKMCSKELGNGAVEIKPCDSDKK